MSKQRKKVIYGRKETEESVIKNMDQRTPKMMLYR